MAHELRDRLVAMGSEQAQAFHDILHVYEGLADRYGLWDAANIMMEWCSDDGFIDFRAWLIAQGKEVYLSALKDPDTLADIEPYGNCCFESLSYVGDDAYRQLTGQNAYENADPAARKKQDGLRIFCLKTCQDCLTMTAAGRLRPSSPRFLTWGTMSNGLCLTANILESRSQGGGCSLSAILTPDAPEKYYLSSEQVARLLYKSSAAPRGPGSTTRKG